MTSVQSSLTYLNSDAALESIERDPYWPKWDSPWWHMLALHELGMTKQIPKRALTKMIAKLNAYYMPTFPIHPSEVPEGMDPVAQSGCHCGTGTLFQILTAAGIDIQKEIPWLRRWLSDYQLPDGGWNCDSEAYLNPEKPSSMVATIAIAEALLACGETLNPKELETLDRAAHCLISRQLTKGSPTKANAEEREDEEDWRKLCFPRFYLYDVLRGLNFIVRWARFRNQPIPPAALSVSDEIARRFPDAALRPERHATDGINTRIPGTSRKESASFFPLLEEISALGRESPALTRQWRETLALLT
ncbi:MAG: hypothetical protein ACXVBW_07760 [Bdellovibrionota bacterium]